MTSTYLRLVSSCYEDPRHGIFELTDACHEVFPDLRGHVTVEDGRVSGQLGRSDVRIWIRDARANRAVSEVRGEFHDVSPIERLLGLLYVDPQPSAVLHASDRIYTNGAALQKLGVDVPIFVADNEGFVRYDPPYEGF